jgi:hypothetical protein
MLSLWGVAIGINCVQCQKAGHTVPRRDFVPRLSSDYNNLPLIDIRASEAI